jgi:Tfp pilus assembly protein PilV
MPTFRTTPCSDRRTSAGRSPLGGEEGFLMVEVIISALLLGFIVIATMNGFFTSNRLTADERAHAQADVIAQQDEERLRGLQTSELTGLNETRQVKLKETTYTVESSAQFISDTTGTSSCSGSGSSADYIETESAISWTALKTRKQVVQSGLVAPPAGGELVVQIENGRGGFTSGMEVSATGASTSSATTGTNGCVIFGPLEEGTYNVTASQAGYVNEDGEKEPPVSKRTTSVTGQSTATKSFQFAKAGAITATFEAAPSSLGTAQAPNVVVAQTGMTTFRELLSADAYTTPSVTSPTTMFPFKTAYTAYAGTCEANKPTAFGASKNPEVQVEPGATSTVKLPLPGMIVMLYTGKSTSKGTLVSKPEVYVKDTDVSGTNCDNTSFKLKTVTTPTTAKGDLEAPGLPYGTYTVCASFTSSGTKHAIKTGVVNSNTTTGTKVELYEGGTSPEVTSGACP